MTPPGLACIPKILYPAKTAPERIGRDRNFYFPCSFFLPEPKRIDMRLS